jgi:hypothetical protein
MLLSLALAAVSAYSQPSNAGVKVPDLTEIAKIRLLGRNPSAPAYPVRFRAVVMYYSPAVPSFVGRNVSLSSETADLFVQDSKAGIWVDVPKDAPPL